VTYSYDPYGENLYQHDFDHLIEGEFVNASREAGEATPAEKERFKVKPQKPLKRNRVWERKLTRRRLEWTAYSPAKRREWAGLGLALPHPEDPNDKSHTNFRIGMFMPWKVLGPYHIHPLQQLPLPYGDQRDEDYVFCMNACMTNVEERIHKPSSWLPALSIGEEDRAISSMLVRLEDSPALKIWLVGLDKSYGSTFCYAAKANALLDTPFEQMSLIALALGVIEEKAPEVGPEGE